MMDQNQKKNSTSKPLTFGRYQALSILGEGSMGRVYLAQDPVLQRKLAVKVIALEKQLDDKIRENYLKRFLIEARASAKLNHPAIVTVHDAGQENNLPWIAFEYVDGESLTAILNRERKLTVNKAVPIALHIASSLQHAQTYHIIHRDIKPANILIDNITGIAKLADFGIAKAPFTELTQEGKIVGSPGYMSPEQITGEELDERSDIFSLGVVMYTMVSGKHPFLRDTIVNTMYATVKGTCEPLNDLVDKVPPALTKAITHCLVTDRNKRLQSAIELIKILKSLDVSTSFTNSYSQKQNDTLHAAMKLSTLSKGLSSLMRVPKKVSEFCVDSLKDIRQAKGRDKGENAKTEIRQSEKAVKPVPGILIATYQKIKQAAFRGLKGLYEIVSSRMSQVYRAVQHRPKNIRILAIYGLIGLITCACGVYFLRIYTLKAVLKNGTVQEAKKAAQKLDAYGITEIEEKRIADCKYMLQNKEYDYAALAAESLKKTKSTAPYGHIFAGQIALQDEEYEKAVLEFEQARKQRGGKKIIKKNLSGILGTVQVELKKDKAPSPLIDLVAVTLSAAKNPKVDKWASHTHYWIRWNAVGIKKRAGVAVDTVETYILDLKHGGSMRTRVRAARKLGEAGDKRAIEPLREAKEKGMRDPFVSGTAATILEKYFE